MIMIAARVALSVQLAGNHCCNGYTKGNQARTAPRASIPLRHFPKIRRQRPLLLRKSRRQYRSGKPTNKNSRKFVWITVHCAAAEAPTDNTAEYLSDHNQAIVRMPLYHVLNKFSRTHAMGQD